MTAVLILGRVSGQPAYLRAFDVDAYDGRGHVEVTGEIDQAMRFPDRAAAVRTWRTRSTVKPTRDDGRPNRPLSSYTCIVEEVPDVAHRVDA